MDTDTLQRLVEDGAPPVDGGGRAEPVAIAGSESGRHPLIPTATGPSPLPVAIPISTPRQACNALQSSWERFKAKALDYTAPWSVSAIVHLLILIAAAVCFIALESGQELHDLIVSPRSDVVSADEVVDLPLVLMSDATGDATQVEGRDQVAMARRQTHSTDTLAVAGLGDPLAVADLSHSPRSLVPTMSVADATKLAARQSHQAVDGGVLEAGRVENAVAGIIGEIRRELEFADLLVIWLVDASISLIDDRQRVAEQLAPFYEEIVARKEKGQAPTTLSSGVVAFGSRIVEVQPPSEFIARSVDAIRHMPSDPSGVENVMEALQHCVSKYVRRDRNVMIVVWTDESGDDVAALEPTIELCRSRDVRVEVVGPSAVLGFEAGSHLWTDANTGYAFRLPVKRGPDTALPERVYLPYWHEGQLPPWSSGNVRIATEKWYGGPHREQLVCGFGPYALTRLALETGGRFRILDRAGDQGRYRLDDLKQYFPAYSSVDEYAQFIHASPLRRALSEASMLSLNEVNIFAPATGFILGRAQRYPYPVIQRVSSPDEFRRELPKEVARQQSHAARAAELIEQMLSLFNGIDMEYWYHREESARWRAWYDLNYGRLLAMSVRHAEYLLCCQELKDQRTIAPNTIRVNLTPSPRYRTGTLMEARAREALRLLTRCVESNPNTPWADLAQWELASELGLAIRQVPQPAPPRPVAVRGMSVRRVPRPPEPVIRFPNL